MKARGHWIKKEDLVKAIGMYSNSMQIAEALNMSYVSVTRACRRFDLICPRNNQGHAGRPKPKNPQRLIQYGQAQLEADRVLALVAQDADRRKSSGKSPNRNRNSRSG